MDEKLLKILKGMFLKEATNNIESLFVLEEQENYKEMASVIHKLIGQSRIIGEEIFALICEEIERAIEENDRELISEKLLLLNKNLEFFKLNKLIW